MTLFDVIGSHVTARAAAELYGLHIVRGGRALCPWHDDHNPDLAFYGARCYCHACHAGGDAVALTAQLHGLSMWKAAQKINAVSAGAEPGRAYKAHGAARDAAAAGATRT